MSEFIRRLMDGAVAIGAKRVRLVSPGRGPGKFRRHAQLVGEIEGRQFRFPIKLRSKDTSRRARNYLHKLQQHIRALQGNALPVTWCSLESAPKVKVRSRSRSRQSRRRGIAHCNAIDPYVPCGDVPPIRYCGPVVSTVSGPFAALANLVTAPDAHT